MMCEPGSGMATCHIRSIMRYKPRLIPKMEPVQPEHLQYHVLEKRKSNGISGRKQKQKQQKNYSADVSKWEYRTQAGKWLTVRLNKSKEVSVNGMPVRSQLVHQTGSGSHEIRFTVNADSFYLIQAKQGEPCYHLLVNNEERPMSLF